MKLLAELLTGLPSDLAWEVLSGLDLAIDINGIALDSRRVRPGDLYVALMGRKTDGHRYTPAAIQNGAAAVVGEQSIYGLQLPYIRVKDSRLALAHLSAAFYDFPAREMTTIGVTGTDGKTTTSNLIFHILKAAGLRAGMVSTVNAVIGDTELDTGFHVTTPEAPDVQRFLAQMRTAGITHVVLEATSHGLAQDRVTGCEFDAGVVTNITHEHLDYHGSYSAYRAAKAKLLDMVVEKSSSDKEKLRLAVLNRDDSSYEYLSTYARSLEVEAGKSINLLSYGISEGALVSASDIRFNPYGTEFTVEGPSFRFPVECSLPGDYNVYNCLAAAAVTVAGLGIDPKFAQEGIRSVRGVPGRMERLELGVEFETYVDFAHTPNALQNALTTVRRIITNQKQSGRVIAVFGSAGLRDRMKRRMMAEASIELADITILTAEDPRTESLDDILAEMASACESKGGVEGQTFWRVPDRGDAIRLAFSLARSGDAVILLGKGHEQSMCFGEIEYPWDDRIAMRAAAAEILGKNGPSMPYLPTSV